MNLQAIVGASVIDGTGQEPIDDAVILIEGERIRSVMPAAASKVPAQARVFEAAGKYIIPGLMDANVHLLHALIADILLPYEGRYAGLIEEAAQLTLRAGVTTVFDTWGPLEPLVVVRDRINHGQAIGSRIFVAGNIIGFDGPLSPDFFPVGNLLAPDTVERINAQFEQGVGQDLLWLTPEMVRQRVRDYIDRADIDFVKYGASGHGKFSQFLAFSAETQRAIVEEGHRAGLTVQAHTTTVESLRVEIEAGADLLQHGEWTGPEPIPEETLKRIVGKSLPVAAIISTEKHLAWVEEHGDERTRTLVFNRVREENIRRLIADGARLLLTTDGFVAGPTVLNHPRVGFIFHCADSPNVLGESHFVWLEAAVQHGMAPMEALLSATRHIAEAYGRADELGTLESGKRADLVILDADPLADPRNYRRISTVMKDGVLIDRGALPANPILTTCYS